MTDLAIEKVAPYSLGEIARLHMAGELKVAERAYSEYLVENPSNMSALNLFGICCNDLGHYKKAERVFEHLLISAPEIVEARIHLAQSRLCQGNCISALQAIDGDVPETASRSEWLLLRARILVQLDDLKKAKQTLVELLAHEKDCRAGLLALANLQISLDELNEAEGILDRLAFHMPDDVDVNIGFAELSKAQKNWHATISFASKVAELYPENLEARKLKAWAFYELGQHDLCLEVAKEMSLVRPDDPSVLDILAGAYHRNGNYHESLMVCISGLSLDPKAKEMLYLVGLNYFKLGDYSAALIKLNQYLDEYPLDIRALQNKGVVLDKLGQYDEAIEIYDLILQSKPDKQTTRFNKSMCVLLKSEFKAGFELYESRFNKETNLLPFYRGNEPLWDGSQELKDHHILIHPEQGFGDTILAARFVKLLDDLDAKFTFAVPKSLYLLMLSLDCKANIVCVGDSVEDVDFHAPLMSLPHLTRDLWESVPTCSSYLKTPDEHHKKWSQILGEKDRPRVGFVCSGNPDHEHDKMRSLNMSEFLAAMPSGVDYHLLQKELRSHERAAVKTRDDVFQHDQTINDFADTSALCDHMDLIVTVDTSTAHLCGALGKEFVVMLSSVPDWRWGVGSEIHWYQQCSKYQQSVAGNWQTVFQNVRTKIETL